MGLPGPFLTYRVRQVNEWGLSVMKLHDLRSKILTIPLMKVIPDTMQERLGMIFLWVSEAGKMQKGEHLFEEGRHDENLGCLLLDGAVIIRKGDHDPITVEAPTLLGEMQQLTPDQARTATVELATAGLVLKFEWHEFVALALSYFTKTEQATLKDVITRSASLRFQELYDQTVEEQLAKSLAEEEAAASSESGESAEV